MPRPSFKELKSRLLNRHSAAGFNELFLSYSIVPLYRNLLPNERCLRSYGISLISPASLCLQEILSYYDSFPGFRSHLRGLKTLHASYSVIHTRQALLPYTVPLDRVKNLISRCRLQSMKPRPSMSPGPFM